MAIGILTGSGTYALPGLESTGPLPVYTPWGEALVSRGTWSGVDVLHISRHSPGHPRLFHIRAGDKQQIEKIVRHARTLGTWTWATARGESAGTRSGLRLRRNSAPR